MNEMIDQMAFLFGCIVLIVVPVGLLAAFIADKTSKNPRNEFDAQRQEDNLEIISLVKKYVKRHPEQRLGQVLRNVGILLDVGVRDSSKNQWETPVYYIDRDIVHEEPCVILDRMQKVLANNYYHNIIVKETKK